MTEQNVGTNPTNTRISGSVSRASRIRLFVGLGASAGGLEAFERFFDHVPVDSGMAFIVVQHLAPEHSSFLAHIISQHTRLSVVDATDEMPLERDHVYVIRAGTSLSIVDGVCRVVLASPGLPSGIDVFFKSLADDQRERAVGILFSGTGTDGTEGLRAIQRRGGRTMVQSPESAKYDAMPSNAIMVGCADVVLPVEKMPAYLVDHGIRLLKKSVFDHSHPGVENISDESILGSLDHICDSLRRASGRDFRQYKRGTLLRRLRHRLQKCHIGSVEEYLEILENNALEVEMLSKELLVGVTQFFRDTEAFESLGGRVIPQILAAGMKQGSVRIWIPGCASGEEAYSIGIILRECMATMRSSPMVQIFATDIDSEVIAEARMGRYPATIVENVSPERLARFFVKENASYQVAKEVREMCVFSEQSLIRDPPFSGLDLISCRNVLIYLEADPQKRLVSLFHYALRRNGYLFLGPSEGLSRHADLFHTVDKRHRIFQKTETTSRPVFEWPVTPHLATRIMKPAPRVSTESSSHEQTLNSRFDRLLLQEYVAPSAVVNEQGDVLCVAGLTGPYFQPPPGLLTTNLLEIAHASLRIELRTALHTAVRNATKVVRDNIVVDIEGSPRHLRLTVRPLPRHETDGYYVVILQEQRLSQESPETSISNVMRDSAMEQLEGELRMTRANLRATIEELESANEELKSSNEELLSTNEEMQSSNEELQSSQEELKSVNEELATVNAELGRRVEELGRANADLQTLFASTDVATLFLDREHRVTKFTPAAKTLFRLIDADHGRPLTDLAPRFHDFDVVDTVANVLVTGVSVERQVETIDRRAWYLLRILPYRSLHRDTIGTVITLIDITKSKNLEAERERLVQELQIAQNQLRADLDATTRLFKIGSLYLRGGNLSLVLDDILDAAISVTGADFGTIQLLDHVSGELRIMAHRGLSRDWINYWNRVATGEGTCGAALVSGSRIIVEDVETSPIFANTPGLEVQLQAGIRAVQSTPLVGRTGSFIGIISTHYKVRRRPDERALRQLDLITRQTADILERANAEDLIRESERRFRVLVNATMDASFRMSPDWTELRQLSGRGFLEDTIAPNRDWLTQYIPDEEQARVLEAIHEAMGTKRVFQLEHRIVRIDGSFGWGSSKAAPLLDDLGNIIEWFGMTRDMTERKRAELDLEQVNARLRDADQRKNEFLGMLSHELRNPLAAIVTSLYLWEHAAVGSDTFHRAQAVIKRQTNHLTRLVDDLLDTTRLTRGKVRLQLERLDLNEVVQRAVEDHRGLFKDHRISLELQSNAPSVWVRGDQTRLSQVIGNLFQNSVKFTPSGGKTTVVLERVKGCALVHVTDTGAGLSSEIMPHIFEAFTQAESTLERSRGGLGLGLAVVKGLIELHGGAVSVSSDGPDKGATFTISLPLDESESEMTPTTPPVQPPSHLRIVIVEDNVDAAETLRDLLTLRGYDVAVAFDGVNAIDLVRRFQPDLVLCDIGLPGMNGYDVVRTLRADPSTNSIMIVALSGYGGPEDVAKTREAGFDGHLVKPLNLETLTRFLISAKHEQT